MPLPQKNIDQIKKHAEKHAAGIDFTYYDEWDSPSYAAEYENEQGYIAGATAEAKRAQETEAIAQKMADALSTLAGVLPAGSRLNYYFAKTEVLEARAALAEWEGRNKEVGDKNQNRQ